MVDREQQVERALAGQGIAVSGLRVRESGSVVGLWGAVESERDRERAERVVADSMQVSVHNHLAARRGVPDDAAQAETGSADVPFADAPAADEAMRSRRYVAKHGDTLEKVARQFYGDAGAWTRVRDANPGRGFDDGVLLAGTELIVP